MPSTSRSPRAVDRALDSGGSGGRRPGDAARRRPGTRRARHRARPRGRAPRRARDPTARGLAGHRGGRSPRAVLAHARRPGCTRLLLSRTAGRDRDLRDGARPHPSGGGTRGRRHPRTRGGVAAPAPAPPQPERAHPHAARVLGGTRRRARPVGRLHDRGPTATHSVSTSRSASTRPSSAAWSPPAAASSKTGVPRMPPRHPRSARAPRWGR